MSKAKKKFLQQELILFHLYLLNHSDGNRQFTLSNKKEFRLLWSTLNGKLKKLKKSGNIVKHHDNLIDEEVQQIFQHKLISINDSQDGGLRFTKYSQKNNQEGIESDNTGLIITVPLDPTDFQGPIHDLKLYISKHPKNYQTLYLHLLINNKFAFGIDTKNCSITNHGRSTSITALFRQGVPIVTTMAITGHKSESSYRVYAKPSRKDKENALSSLINNIELSLKQNHIENITATQNNMQDNQAKLLESM
ncbi:8296_t:CDS:2, partial [Cetraspora pellucida]